MKTEKFQFIELPRPEITISEFGMSEILGGTLCTHYIVCLGTSSDKKYDGTCNPGSYRPDLDCHGNPIGCEGGLFCSSYFQPCIGNLQTTDCPNFCADKFK